MLMEGNDPTYSPSDFVAVLNQTLEYAYPSAVVVGEVANFRVSKNRWVYFDLQDEGASVKCFATVYQLPGPLENGMMLRVRALPRLHPLYGFSLNVQVMQPAGEGSLKKAADLLAEKLHKEGLFDSTRKRPVPYPPRRIGLITSGESAAYQDFIKILNARWGGIEVLHADVQVQGDAAVGQIMSAIDYFNSHSEPVDTLVIIRGGGSADDLAAFSSEQVTRAVAGSRSPTLVAIGHEVDVCLAELTADQRASTPSNAAELMVPDKRHVLERIDAVKTDLPRILNNFLVQQSANLKTFASELGKGVDVALVNNISHAQMIRSVLNAFDPAAALARGYAILRAEGKVIKSVKSVKIGQAIDISMHDGSAHANVTSIDL